MLQHSKRNPYLAGEPPRLDRSGHGSWRDVVVRMVLVIVPGQFVGYLLGAVIAAGTGAFTAGPFGLTVGVIAGVLTGTTVGIVVSPPPRRRPVGAAISTGLAVGASTLLIMLASTRLASNGYLPGPADFAPLVVVTAAGQGLTSWLVWGVRAHSVPPGR